MTQLPPPLPPPYLPPTPPTVARPTLGVYVAWILILLAAAAVIALSAYKSEQPGGAAASQVSLEFELQSRYLIGSKQLAGAKLPPEVEDQILKTLRSLAQTPADRLRLAAVEGELSGKQAALDEIRSLANADLPPPIRDDVQLFRQIYAEGASSLPQSRRDELIADFGWFGQLALSNGADPPDPLRQVVLNDAIRVVVISIALLCVGGLFFVLGVILLIVLARRFFRGRIPAKYHASDVAISDLMIQGFAAWMVLMLLLGLAGIWLGPKLGIYGNALLLIPFFAALGYVRGRGVGWEEIASALGWSTGQGVLREMRAGIVGYIAGFPVLFIASLITLLLVRASGAQPAHPIIRYAHAEPGLRIALVFLACVFAPITEESIFRGMLMGHLRRRTRWIFAALVTSLIFAAIHPQGWAAIPVLGTIAMVLAALREQRDSLIASCTAHAFNNAIALSLLFLLAG